MTEISVLIGTCRSCQAPIIWAWTGQGRRIPLDSEPVTNGRFVLNATGGGEPIAIYVGKAATPPGTDRYDSHFATCPNAEQHRR